MDQLTVKALQEWCKKHGKCFYIDRDNAMTVADAFSPDKAVMHNLETLAEVVGATPDDPLSAYGPAASGSAIATLEEAGYTYHGGVRWKPPIGRAPDFVHPRMRSPMQAAGYESLAKVLEHAFYQAAHGKGAERHAQGEPFDRQVMQDMARRFGVGALLGQAFKKSEESQRLPRERAVAELLGAINYLAGAVIALEGQPVANDNAAGVFARG